MDSSRIRRLKELIESNKIMDVINLWQKKKLSIDDISKRTNQSAEDVSLILLLYEISKIKPSEKYSCLLGKKVEVSIVDYNKFYGIAEDISDNYILIKEKKGHTLVPRGNLAFISTDFKEPENDEDDEDDEDDDDDDF